MAWGEIISLCLALVALGFCMGLVAGIAAAGQDDEREPCSDYDGD